MAMSGAIYYPTVPSTSIASLAERLRAIKQPEHDGMDVLKPSLAERQDIETVSTESLFNKKITEKRDVITNGVVLQQGQYEQCKTTHIRAMFGYLSDEEASELLKECDEDEVEAVSRLSQPDCLPKIRKNIALKYDNPEEDCLKPVMTVEQMLVHKQLVKKRVMKPKRKTNAYERKRLRQQCQTGIYPGKTHEGL